MIRDVGLPSQSTMTRREDVELQGFYRLQPRNQTVQIRVGEILIRQPFHSDDVDGKHGALGRKAHHDEVIRMAGPEVDQLDLFPTEVEGLAVVERDLRN